MRGISRLISLGLFLALSVAVFTSCSFLPISSIVVTLGSGGSVTGATIIFATNAPTDPSHVLQYLWLFGDGNQGMGNPISHIFSTPGTYTAQVNIALDDGRLIIFTTTITITQSMTKLYWANDGDSHPPALRHLRSVALHMGHPGRQRHFRCRPTKGNPSQRDNTLLG